MMVRKCIQIYIDLAKILSGRVMIKKVSPLLSILAEAQEKLRAGSYSAIQ